MTQGVTGLHHVTAIASDPQTQPRFRYPRLGLRLVKRTVNFDAPDTYHFYYGDSAGSPGSSSPFSRSWTPRRAAPGTGMVETTAFAVPAAAFDTWVSRLADEGRDFEGPTTRFGTQTLGLRGPGRVADRAGGRTWLGRCGAAQRSGSGHPVQRPSTPSAVSIRSRSALRPRSAPRTPSLTTFGYQADGEEAGRQRFRQRRRKSRSGIVDLLRQPDQMRGRMAGTVHHVAFRARDETEQLTWREAILALGFDVTPVLDRQYFQSIYFREPGGVLFEIATDPPGFAI